MGRMACPRLVQAAGVCYRLPGVGLFIALLADGFWIAYEVADWWNDRLILTEDTVIDEHLRPLRGGKWGSKVGFEAWFHVCVQSKRKRRECHSGSGSIDSVRNASMPFGYAQGT